MAFESGDLSALSVVVVSWLCSSSSPSDGFRVTETEFAAVSNLTRKFGSMKRRGYLSFQSVPVGVAVLCRRLLGNDGDDPSARVDSVGVLPAYDGKRWDVIWLRWNYFVGVVEHQWFDHTLDADTVQKRHTNDNLQSIVISSGGGGGGGRSRSISGDNSRFIF